MVRAGLEHGSRNIKSGALTTRPRCFVNMSTEIRVIRCPLARLNYDFNIISEEKYRQVKVILFLKGAKTLTTNLSHEKKPKQSKRSPLSYKTGSLNLDLVGKFVALTKSELVSNYVNSWTQVFFYLFFFLERIYIQDVRPVGSPK